MVPLAVVLIVVLVLQERILVTAVRGKRHRRNTQAGEGALEPVPPAEKSCVSPVLTVDSSLSAVLRNRMRCLYKLTIAPMGRSEASRRPLSAFGCRIQ